MTPTARTLAWLRKQGYTAAVCEFWNPHVKRRKDLFGFADIIAFDKHKVILVQATSGAHTSDREKKIRANEAAMNWIKFPTRLILVVGWRQLVAYRKDGSKAKRKKWTAKVSMICDGSTK